MEITRRNLGIGTLAIAAVSVIPNVAFAIVPDTVHIFPDIRFCESQTQMVEENTKTIIYNWMNKWNVTKGTWETRKVGSPEYAQWMIDHPPEDGIPHHISFGGAVVAGASDPTFKDRWYARTIEHLKTGRLA